SVSDPRHPAWLGRGVGPRRGHLSPPHESAEERSGAVGRIHPAVPQACHLPSATQRGLGEGVVRGGAICPHREIYASCCCLEGAAFMSETRTWLRPHILAA